jgi:hypothetical protein
MTKSLSTISSSSDGTVVRDRFAAWQAPAPESLIPLDTMVYEYYPEPNFGSELKGGAAYGTKEITFDFDAPNMLEQMLLDTTACKPGAHTINCDGEFCRV